MKAIPRIMVRIDRGEDWVEVSGEKTEQGIISQGGNLKDWLDYNLLLEAWETLNKAVME